MNDENAPQNLTRFDWQQLQETVQELRTTVQEQDDKIVRLEQQLESLKTYVSYHIEEIGL